MNILESKLYLEKIRDAFNHIVNFKLLENKTILITGCNGLICSNIVDILIIANKELNFNIKLYLATRNIEETKLRFNLNDKDELINVVQYDGTKTFVFNESIDFIIHGASPASPNLYVSNPVETMLCNFIGLKNLLDIAKKSNAKLLYISSSEVYGKLETSDSIKEEDMGIMDLLNPRSSYGMSKRAAETLCISYANEYSIKTVIVRPGHIYGPTAKRNDKRVSNQFMYDVIEKKDLVLKSKGEQIRSYTNCMDSGTAILSVLLNGENGVAYNISNPKSIISIADMAKYFANAGDVRVTFDLPSDEEKKAFNPMNNSSLNSRKLEALGWKPMFAHEDGFTFSVDVLKSLKR